MPAEYMKWADVPTKDRKFYRKSTFTAGTCGCVIEFMWDDRTSEEDRLHLPFDTLHACTRHAHLRDANNHEPLHEEVWGENIYFGHAMRNVLAALPEEHKVVKLDEEGGRHEFFKKEPDWRFNDKGELEVSIAGIPPGDLETKKACADCVKTHLGKTEFADADHHPNLPKLKPFRNRKVHIK